MNQYERVARQNSWTEEQRLQNVYFSLEGTSRHWYENRDFSFPSWDVSRKGLKGTFVNIHLQERAEVLLWTKTQGPNESVTAFVEDVLRLSARADSRATDDKKLRVLMRGVRDNIFGSFVHSPPTTVKNFCHRGNEQRAYPGSPTQLLPATTRRRCPRAV